MFGGRFSLTAFGLRNKRTIGIKHNFSEEIKSTLKAFANYRVSEDFKENISAEITFAGDKKPKRKFRRRFSLYRFSLSGGINREIKIQESFTENTWGLISLGGNTPVEHVFRCSIHEHITVTRGVLAKNELSESITAIPTGRINYLITQSFHEDLSSWVYVSSDLRVASYLSEHLNANIFMGKNISHAEKYSETLSNRIFMGKNISTHHNFTEAIFSKIYSVILDKDVIIINVSIPPNSELRINSMDYTATLNGNNIIHLHQGDWIKIDREVIDIAIESGNARLEGSLLYTERFL